MDNHYNGPISAKGIVFDEGAVWLRKNERNEWELPGGKVDQNEQPAATVARELREELGFTVRVVQLIDAFMYTIPRSMDESRGVLVVSYWCELLARDGPFETWGEAGLAEFRKFPIAEISSLIMPDFYKTAILKAQAERERRAR
jgi:8-oxo-dGTP pyrophosphatase MutT (NUDIX family)